MEITVTGLDVTPEKVFAWEGGTYPGLLQLPGLSEGFEVILGYEIPSMQVKSLRYKTPPGVKIVTFLVTDHKKRKTLARLPGTWGTSVIIYLQPRFKLEMRGGAAFFPMGVEIAITVE